MALARPHHACRLWSADPRPGLQDLALLILRLSGLYLAVGHGWLKFSSLVSGNGAWVVDFVARLGLPAPALFAWALGITEFVGGLCIALGLGTRLFAVMAAFAMFVAAFVRHRAVLHLAAWTGLASPSQEELRFGR